MHVIVEMLVITGVWGLRLLVIVGLHVKFLQGVQVILMDSLQLGVQVIVRVQLQVVTGGAGYLKGQLITGGAGNLKGAGCDKGCRLP